VSVSAATSGKHIYTRQILLPLMNQKIRMVLAAREAKQGSQVEEGVSLAGERRRNEELLFNGYRVSLWDDEKDRNGW